MGLYGRVKGTDHCHCGIRRCPDAGAELDTAGAIDLVAGASLFEHRGSGDELVEERRLGIGERSACACAGMMIASSAMADIS